MLYILAVTSVGVYGIVLAGWASGSTYPLLGGLRSSEQVISYEIAMALSYAAVFIYAGTMSTSRIVAAQQGTWSVFLLLTSVLVFLLYPAHGGSPRHRPSVVDLVLIALTVVAIGYWIDQYVAYAMFRVSSPNRWISPWPWWRSW